MYHNQEQYTIIKKRISSSKLSNLVLVLSCEIFMVSLNDGSKSVTTLSDVIKDTVFLSLYYTALSSTFFSSKLKSCISDSLLNSIVPVLFLTFVFNLFFKILL